MMIRKILASVSRNPKLLSQTQLHEKGKFLSLIQQNRFLFSETPTDNKDPSATGTEDQNLSKRDQKRAEKEKRKAEKAEKAEKAAEKSAAKAAPAGGQAKPAPGKQGDGKEAGGKEEKGKKPEGQPIEKKEKSSRDKAREFGKTEKDQEAGGTQMVFQIMKPLPPPPQISRENVLSFEEIVKKWDQTKVSSLHALELPYLFQGMEDFDIVKKTNDDYYFNDSKTNTERVSKEMHTAFLKYLQGLASEPNKLEAFPLCELNLFLAAQKALKVAKNSGISFKLVRDEEGFKSSGLKEGMKIFERVNIFGVNVNRGENLTEEDYYVEDRGASHGTIAYTSKEMETEEFGQIGHIRYRQALVRLYVQFTTPFRILAFGSDGKQISPPETSFRHVAIFENQLRKPPFMSYHYMDFDQWMKEYRLGFKWTLTDVDGRLNGNPHVVSQEQSAKRFQTVPKANVAISSQTETQPQP